MHVDKAKIAVERVVDKGKPSLLKPIAKQPGTMIQLKTAFAATWEVAAAVVDIMLR